MQSEGAVGLATTAIGGLAGGASTASAANFEAMKYANTEINFLMTGDENDHRALADLLPEMKAGQAKSEALRPNAPNALRLGLISRQTNAESLH